MTVGREKEAPTCGRARPPISRRPGTRWVLAFSILWCGLGAAADRPAPELSPGTSHPPALAIGDPAPPLHVGRWLRGAPVEGFEPGTIYVLDFWALWCPPCVALLPHLSVVQDRFASRGVRVIGVIGPDTTGTTEDAVARFLEQRSDRVRVSVAFDALEDRKPPALDVLQGRTTSDYLEGAQLEGVPIAFVIDREGRVAWIGQPAELEPVLEAVAGGRWDRAQAAEHYRAARAAEPELIEVKALLRRGQIAEGTSRARTLAEGVYAGESSYLRVIANALADAAQARAPGVDLDLALKTIQRAEALSAGNDPTVLAALARVYHLRGDDRQAVAAQERAVALSEAPAREALAKTLERYRGAAPRHRP